MAIFFMDGFDHYNNTSQKGWSVSATCSSSYSRLGVGQGVREAGEMKHWLGGTNSHLIMGCAFRCTAPDANGYSRQVGLGSSSAPTVFTRWAGNIDYHWQVDYPGGSITSTNDPALANVWYYLELDVVFHATTGSITLKVNGQTECSGTNLNTGSAADYCWVREATWYGTQDYDDLYVDDSTARGDCRVETIYPTADSSVQWTPGTGSTNYNLVDNPGTISEGSTDFVETSTATNTDLYTLGNITTTSGSVYAVQSNVYARKTDAGSRTMHSEIKHSGSTSNGSTINLADTGLIYSDAFANVPGGSGWTITQVNALEAGFELDS